MSVAQWVEPGLLGRLERTEAGLHGDWWRSATALVVQDGGAAGTISNLVFLLAIGAVAEQLVTRPRWLAHYVGIGLASEFVGYAWQPVGGGNSVAICGLAGVIAVVSWRHHPTLNGLAPLILLVWAGALVGTIERLALPAAMVSAIVIGVTVHLRNRGRSFPRTASVALVAVGLLLTAVANIHGPALLAGVAVAAVTMPIDQTHRNQRHPEDPDELERC